MMETIRVNMTPCEDVQTIHASQNDNEAREWGFELHNNGEKIDSSSISDQLVFKAYENGTEQILPENGSTPTTSPFKGDIKYPQGLLSDQEFLYRESPTEEDGLAKITDIKGNTLVWNQLMENGNFADTSKWSAESGATLSISNNIATISSTTANNGIRQYFSNPLTVNHKYLIKAEFNVPTEYRCVIGTAANQGVQTDKLISTTNTWTEVIGIGTCTIATTTFYCFVRGTTYENVKVRNVMCFDLTQMGLDISNPSDFTSLFSLPYYDYNAGTLLSFTGTGLKTIGKNIYSLESENVSASGITLENNGDGTYRLHGTAIGLQDFRIRTGNESLSLKKGTYKFSGIENGSASTYRMYASYHEDGVSTKYVAVDDGVGSFTLTDDGICVLFLRVYAGATIDVLLKPMLTFGYVTDQTFEPYTTQTTNLPIATYFPTGMKSAGSVYDELTESKAITRVGSVDLGSLEWTYSSTFQRFSSSGISTEVLTPSSNARVGNILSSIYTTTSVSRTVPESRNDDMLIAVATSGNIIIVNESYGSDATALKTAMSGVYLYYELKTPTETSFTTASLVTENAEIPLSNEDGVLIGKCTEQLSENQGFFDAKIKLSDADGECYSNKIQLHIERSPQ